MRIAIIGAGINGLYLAWKLSKKGCDVTVFEKKNKIGNEVCSGLFSQRILDFIPESKSLIQNKIKFVLIHFPKKTVRVNFSKPIFVMSHSELDKLVADLSRASGAEISLNRKISEIPSGFDMIIGCDGADSVIRKKMGLPGLKFRLGIQGFVKKNDSSDYVETWPCRNGFLWRIPRNNEVEYGIIAGNDKAYKIFTAFLKNNKIEIKNVGAKIIPQGLFIPNNPLMDSGQVTLCGDAAGLTKPWSGGGVIWGLTAADILLKTFPDFTFYRQKTRIFFIPKILLSKIAIKLAYFLGYNFPYLLPKNVKIESDFLF